jgi:hypothetical protein
VRSFRRFDVHDPDGHRTVERDDDGKLVVHIGNADKANVVDAQNRREPGHEDPVAVPSGAVLPWDRHALDDLAREVGTRTNCSKHVPPLGYDARRMTRWAAQQRRAGRANVIQHRVHTIVRSARHGSAPDHTRADATRGCSHLSRDIADDPMVHT